LDCDEKRQENRTEVAQLRFNTPLLGVTSRNRMTNGGKKENTKSTSNWEYGRS